MRDGEPIYYNGQHALTGLSMGMSFLWESHGKRPMGWDRHVLLWDGMGMGQINMSHGQPCELRIIAGGLQNQLILS